MGGDWNRPEVTLRLVSLGPDDALASGAGSSMRERHLWTDRKRVRNLLAGLRVGPSAFRWGRRTITSVAAAVAKHCFERPLAEGCLAGECRKWVGSAGGGAMFL